MTSYSAGNILKVKRVTLDSVRLIRCRRLQLVDKLVLVDAGDTIAEQGRKPDRVACLEGAGERRHGCGGILKVHQYLAVTGDRDDVRRALGFGSEESWQPLRDFAQPRFVREFVEQTVSGCHEADPESAVQPVVDVVGESRKVFDDHFALPSARPLQPVPPHAVVPCFVEQQVLLIVTDRDTIREIESIRNNDRVASSRIEFENPPVATVFENVEQARLVGAARFAGAEFGEKCFSIPLAFSLCYREIG